MAQSPEQIRQALDRYLSADFRGRLRARGIARGMVWRDGVVPEGSPPFPETLSADLLDFGYGVLALALELRDANRTRLAGERFRTEDAFEVAAEAIESSVRRADPRDESQGRHLVVAAAAFHLGGFAARSYSLLPLDSLNKNLASCERALALLLRRDLLNLRESIVSWIAREEHTDDAIAERLADESDAFDVDDAVVLATTAAYYKALGLLDSALLAGRLEAFARAVEALSAVVTAASTVGNIPLWWVATLSIHLSRDLWEQSLHTQLPGPRDDLPERWGDLRRDFIVQLANRRPPHIDLWPSQLEAARRAVNPRDDLVIALPTSAGKTRIAELCILRSLADRKRVVYVTPLRALSAQVERVLARTFVPLHARVTSLYGAIGASSIDHATLVDADVVVATPEKLDFALRQDPHVIDDVGLIVLDEGHMIGLGSREIRYEVLIQRLLRRDDASERRLVCLSAMFNPDDVLFSDFAAWLRSDEEGGPVHVRWRPTRQRLAHLDWMPSIGAARLSFLEGEAAFVQRFVESKAPRKPRKKAFPANEVEFCIAAADAFARDGHSVLVYSPQRSQIDPLVREFKHVHKQGYLTAVKAPDPLDLATALAIGREWLGPAHPAVEALQIGVGTHHGALPRPFQHAVEQLLERKRLPVVVASPTLAQGVDLSCSVLLFRSLTRFDPETETQEPIQPPEFANVVGRAGRAYVDLDAIVALPSFEQGWSRTNRHNQFEKLIKNSRSQRLLSGLAHLLFALARRICARLGIEFEGFLEYVVNSGTIWADPKLVAPDDQSQDEDEAVRSLDEYIADLDVAILSLVDPLEASPEQLAELLDRMLKDSLWKRTLERANEGVRAWERGLLLSRAEWIWKHTTLDQRRGCFAAGLGERAGLFIHQNLDVLVDLLSRMQTAVMSGATDDVVSLGLAFAEKVFTERFFLIRSSPPETWREALSKWLRGTGFAELLTQLGKREEQRTQAFIQEGVVFRLVWAAEAVRVQAVTTSHPRSEELGDGPMLAFTHGVPTIPAALLCQAGYASRTGALWVTGKLSAAFFDIDGMREWMEQHKSLLADELFWDSGDHRLLWNNVWRAGQQDFPRAWTRRTIVVSVTWLHEPPEAGTVVRLFPRTDSTATVCAEDLSTLGSANLGFNPAGAPLEAVVRVDSTMAVTYFGPN